MTTDATVTKPTVAIVGGGYAGMAAAVTLTVEGIKCTVLESGKTLGGRARRIDYRDEAIDNGQHILSGAYTELLRLMRIVGVADSALQRVPLRLSIPPNFLLSAPRTKLLRGPLYLGWTLLRAKGLTFTDRLAAIGLLRMLKRTKFRVDAHKTVENLLTEHRQPQNLIDHLWHPLTISALNTPLSTASAQVFANVLRDSLASTREASDLLLPRVDLTALFPAPAAAWISGHGGAVRTAARVKQIDIADHRYRAFFESDSEMFDAIIFAVGPQQLEGLMADVAAPALAYEPIVTIYFKFDSPIRMCEPMSGQVGGLAQWYFDRRALSDTPGLPPDAGGLIAAVISASGPHELLSAEALAERVLAELAARVPGLPKPVWQKVINEKFATFACTPGANRPGAATSYPGVFLAGDYVAGDYPATLEGAVRNGIAAAQATLDYLRTITSIP